MHLTDHVTDVQLNEYLDNESSERAQIEAHLASCDGCAARLTALQTLFTEIEALPELTLSTDLAARFATTPSLKPQLPRWFTLTASLQAVLALIVLLLAAPFIANLLPPIEMPSMTAVFIQLQAQWAAQIDTLSNFQFPTVPQIAIPELSTLMLTFTLAGASLLWLVGNGLLLRKRR